MTFAVLYVSTELGKAVQCLQTTRREKLASGRPKLQIPCLKVEEVEELARRLDGRLLAPEDRKIRSLLQEMSVSKRENNCHSVALLPPEMTCECDTVRGGGVRWLSP